MVLSANKAIMDIIFLSIFTLIFIFSLIFWNLRTAYHVHQWSGDSKNVRTLLAAMRFPERFEKDFPFCHAGKFRFYMPFFNWFILKLEEKFGRFENTIVFLHIVMTCIFISGWSLFLFLYSHSALTAGASLLILLPCAIFIGDGLSAGLPRLWTPRFLANAFTPVFVLFLWWSNSDSSYLLPTALISGVIFNLHPRNGVGTFLLFCIMGLQLYITQDVTLSIGTLCLLINCLLVIPYCYFYFNYTNFTHRLPASELEHFNLACKKRFDLWPKIGSGSFYGKLLLEKGQLFIGTLYIALSLFLFILHGDLATSTYFFIQSLLNLFILSTLADRECHYSLYIILLALLGLFSLPEEAVMISLIVLGGFTIVYFFRPAYSFPVFVVGSVMLISSYLLISPDQFALLAPRNSFDLALLWSVPILYSSYLINGSIFHWLLPFILKKQSWLTVDLLQPVKIALLHIYFLAFGAISQLAKIIIDTSSLNNKIYASLCMATSIFCLFKYLQRYYPVTDDNLDIYDWVKKHTSPTDVFHVVSKLPPHSIPTRPDTASFPFFFRANTLRPITGSWKDGGFSLYSSPQIFLEWQKRMDEVEKSMLEESVTSVFSHAKSLGADYVVVSNNFSLAHNGIPEAIEKFRNYSVYSLRSEGRSTCPSH